MKKLLAILQACLLLACLLLVCLPLGALAAEGAAEGAEEAAEAVQTAAPEAYTARSITLTGQIDAGAEKPVFAPFGGVVGEALVSESDIVRAGDTLLTLETTKVYAPCDGIVGSLRAQAGDDITTLVDRYGALLYIEPAGTFLVETDTTYAYASAENLLVHVGETVYIGSRNSSARLGTGFVTKVENEAYTVEVTSGNLIMGDNVSIFRTSDLQADSKIGSGTISRNALVPVTAEGSVYTLHVQQGDAVKKGDLLLETVQGSLDYNAYPTNQVPSGYDAIVATMNAAVGDSVSKGQTLAILYPMDSLRVVVQASESDLRNIRLGDSVTIECTGLSDSQQFEGVVYAISGLATEGEEQVTFPVTIQFEPRSDVRIGMSAIVYFNR